MINTTRGEEPTLRDPAVASILFYVTMAVGFAFIVYIGKIITDDRALIFGKKKYGSYVQFFFMHRRRQAIVMTILFAVYLVLFVVVWSMASVRAS